jgi:IS605 OrfB family transposase
MKSTGIFSYQARLHLDAGQDAAISAYASLYGRVERKLFAAMQTKATLNDLKRRFLLEYGITARQFNNIRVGLEGKIDSIKARRPELITELQSRIKKSQKTIQKIQERLETLRTPEAAFKKGKALKTLSPEERVLAATKTAFKLHQKKRRLHILQTKLTAMQADQKDGRVRLCFGSKKLFHAQFEMEAIRNKDDAAWKEDPAAWKAAWEKEHAAWKDNWQAERASQFFAVGSQDETAGNQSCQAVVQPDGTLTLDLRMPNACAADHGKRVQITGVQFAYGQDKIVAALASSQRIAAKTKKGTDTIKRIGSALSYRFVRDAKSWRVFVSCSVPAAPINTQADLGAIGVDINADHLAVGILDRFGNAAKHLRIDTHTYGKTSDQAKAIIGDAAVKIVAMAQASGKPIVIEKLDFAKKKAELEGTRRAMARMLSSFACNQVASSIKAAAFRAGVEVIEVNPAYTSVIGSVNHAQRRGVSVHMGAAVAIARRGLGLSENPPVRAGLVPVRNGGHVTFVLPVRNRTKHVWSYWAQIRKHQQAAHVAHYRSDAAKEAPAPLTPAMRSLCASRQSMVRSRGASQQLCSADDIGDVPC